MTKSTFSIFNYELFEELIDKNVLVMMFVYKYD